MSKFRTNQGGMEPNRTTSTTSPPKDVPAARPDEKDDVSTSLWPARVKDKANNHFGCSFSFSTC
jgi:hypothetical protein